MHQIKGDAKNLNRGGEHLKQNFRIAKSCTAERDRIYNLVILCHQC